MSYHKKLKIHYSKNLYFLFKSHKKRPLIEDQREKWRHAITCYQHHECQPSEINFLKIFACLLDSPRHSTVIRSHKSDKLLTFSLSLSWAIDIIRTHLLTRLLSPSLSLNRCEQTSSNVIKWRSGNPQRSIKCVSHLRPPSFWWPVLTGRGSSSDPLVRRTRHSG